MTNAILRGKPDAGNPHVRFDEGEVASAKPRRGSLLYNRREFCIGVATATLCGESALSDGMADNGTGWTRGHFQVHQIYTGKAESYFLVFPDGTSMLLDCGDSNPHTFQAQRFGDRSVPILPDESEPAGAWIARYVARANPRGKDVDYLFLSHFHGDHSSGFKDAIETLRFRRAIDRGWPNYDDPLPYPKDERWMGGSLTDMRRVYARLQARDGLMIEKFRVGARDQICLLQDAKGFPDFTVFNLCGCGKVAMPDGTTFDCYGEEHGRHKTCVYNENAMSLGMVFTYGKFKFYTAGDFTASDGLKGTWKGKKTNIESILAKACSPVSVAKANHHAAWACPDDLVAALRPKVWLASVWWQLQCDAKTMARLSSRSSYAGERLLLPGVMCAERRREDAGAAYLADVPNAVHTPAHVVIDVPPGGETFTVACIDPTTSQTRLRSTFRTSDDSRDGNAE